MKFLYPILAFLLLMNCATFGQKFQSGYLTFPNDSTIFVDIQLTANNKAAIKYQENGKAIKAFKIKLKDYGTLLDGQKKSDYANSAFKEITFDAYYVSKETNDTSHFYFLEHTYHKITGYLPNRKKLILYPKGIATVFINNSEAGIFYDGLDLKEYGSSRPDHTHKFLERIIGGKVALYELKVMNMDPKIVFKQPYSYDMNSNKKMYGKAPKILRRLEFQSNTSYSDIYVLRKEKEIYISIYRNTQYNGESQIKNAIKDFPYLANKIGKPGYQFIDIPDIIEEYNSYWAKRQK